MWASSGLIDMGPSSWNTRWPATQPRVPRKRSQSQSQAGVEIGLKKAGRGGYGWPGVGMVKLLRRFVDDPGAVDAVVVVLATWFVRGGYVAAYGYVRAPGVLLVGGSRAGP